MYFVNYPLIRNLHKLFGMTQKQFSMLALGSEQLFSQKLGKIQRLFVTDIIKFANTTKIPIRHFFTTKEVPDSIITKDKVVHKGTWQDIELRRDGLQALYNCKEYDFSLDDITSKMGIDPSCFWRWVNGECYMRGQQLCDICNEFGIDLADIINDKNDIIPPATESARDARLQMANTRLERRIKNQEERIAALADIINTIVKERDLALDEVAKSKAKSRKRNNIDTERTSEVAESEIERWEWQPKRWDGENIPTLTQFIDYCNEHKLATAAFLKYSYREHVTDVFSPITLDMQTYQVFAFNIGLQESADNILITKFCRCVNDNGFSPACCINDSNSHYPALLSDRLLRIVSKDHSK